MIESQEKTVIQPRSNWLMTGIITVMFIAITWPTWRWLWGEWMATDYYSHGVLILPVALYLGWRRITNSATPILWGTQSENRSIIVMAIMLALYLFFYNDKAYYLASFAMVAMLAALVWTLGGWQTLIKLAFPIGYLILMIPLPFIERITLPLALWTGICSGYIVRFLGLDVEIIGTAVKLPNANLAIGAQCSGINSMIALISLTTLAAYLLKGPVWGRIALVLVAIPLAMLGNILRVSNLLFIARYYGADAAFTFYHDYSGIVFFVVVMSLFIPIIRLLRCKTLRYEVL